MSLSLVVGPAHSGKVGTLLDRFVAALDHDPWLIVPQRADVERVERELLERQGGLLAGTSWTSFDGVFSAGIAELTSITSKPLFISEVGAPEVGGDKAAWVTDMFATLADRPEIKGFTWFSHQKEADWRIDSSPGSLAAFKAGLATY